MPLAVVQDDVVEDIEFVWVRVLMSAAGDVRRMASPTSCASTIMSPTILSLWNVKSSESSNSSIAWNISCAEARYSSACQRA